MSAFPNLLIWHKLAAAFAAVVAVIFVSSAIVYDRLRVIETAKNWRVHTTDRTWARKPLVSTMG